ncbi:hypothetical protein PCE1_002313 [Barthelona sp. PCE]
MNVEELEPWSAKGLEFTQQLFDNIGDVLEDYANFSNLGRWEPDYAADTILNDQIVLVHRDPLELEADCICLSIDENSHPVAESCTLKMVDAIGRPLLDTLDGLGALNQGDIRTYSIDEGQKNINYKKVFLACVPPEENLPTGIKTLTVNNIGSVSVLLRLYQKCLTQAVQNDFETIVLTPLAVLEEPTAMKPGYGLIPAAHAALRFVRAWLDDGVNSSLLTKVVFCVSSKREYAVYKDLMLRIFPISRLDHDDKTVEDFDIEFSDLED